MTKSLKYIATSMLFACGCFWTLSANANVCFLPRGNCADSEVSGIDINPDDLASKCVVDGYTTRKTDCVSPQQIGDYCPYDNNWVKCCGAEYTLQCESTNIVLDKCGKLVKCGCAEEFNYIEQTITEDNKPKIVCRRYNPLSRPFDNSLADYDSGICYLPTYENGNLTTVALYKGCICDPTIYPRTQTICKARGMIGGGTVCKDSSPQGTERFTKCVCAETILTDSCDYGVPPSATQCTSEEGVQYTSTCCQCNASQYPYTTIPPEVDTYTSCRSFQNCSGGNSDRYRAKSCKPGYEVNESTGKCELQTCSKALKAYLKYSSNSSYGLLTANGVVDIDGNTSNATKVIVADDVTITTQSTNGSSSSSGGYYMCRQRTCIKNYGRTEYYQDTDNCMCINCCLENHMNGDALEQCEMYHPCNYSQLYPYSHYDTVCKPNYDYVCTDKVYKTSYSTSTNYKGLVNSSATQYISAREFLNTNAVNDPLAATAKMVCNNTPTITYTASTFPANDTASASNQTLKFSDVILKFSRTTNSYRNLQLTDGGLNITGTLYTYGPVSMSSSSSSGSVDITGKLEVMDSFTSSGYSYNESSSYGSGTINILIPAKYRSSNPARFTFGSGQVFKVSNLAISSATDQYMTTHSGITTAIVNQYLPLAYPYTATIDFEGPSSSGTANVYTNLSLGYIPGRTLRTSFLTLRMSGNLDWNMSGRYANHTIGLSTGSKIYSSDYGHGNYARIYNGSNKSYAWCKMTDTIYYGRDRHRFLDCEADSHIESVGTNEPLGASSYYACYISSSGSTYRQGSAFTVTVKPDGDCSRITTTSNYGCSFDYSKGHDEAYHGPKTGVMLTCGDSD